MLRKLSHPLELARPLDPKLLGVIGQAPVYKADDLTPNGSHYLISDQTERPTSTFKVVGVLNQMQGSSHSVIASAGSAAMAAAYGARLSETHVTVFVPEHAAPERTAKIRRLGMSSVKLIERGTTFDEAAHVASTHSERTHAKLLHPFASLDMLAGNYFVIDEAVRQAREQAGADSDLRLVIGVGGAGLLAAACAYSLNNPNIRVSGVQFGPNTSAEQSVQAGHVVSVDSPDALCAGSAVRATSEINRTVLSRAHELGRLSFARASRADVGRFLWGEQLRRAPLLDHYDDATAYENFPEATGGLAESALQSGTVTANPGEVMIAFRTGANPDLAAERALIDAHLGTEPSHLTPQKIFTGGKNS